MQWFAFGFDGSHFRGDKQSAGCFPFVPLNPFSVFHTALCPRMLIFISTRPPCPLAFNQVHLASGKHQQEIREQKVWRVYLPASSLRGYSSVVAKFIYLWPKTLSGRPTGTITVLAWSHKNILPLSFQAQGWQWLPALTNTENLTIPCCFP